MADVRNEEALGSEKGGAADRTTEVIATARKPYHAPQLRYLGSVRELTATGSGTDPEAGGFKNG